jgi:hypothetical protein
MSVAPIRVGRSRRLRNKHEYSDFKVFKVDQKNTIGAPKQSP